MTHEEDAKLEAALAKALGPDAEDTAPLSRAVLSRLAEESNRRAPLAEVLTAPGPAAGLMLGALLLAGAFGYALVSPDLQEAMTLYLLIGQGL